MPDNAPTGGSFWKRIPDFWKFVTVLVAIGATAIGGYKWVDDTIDGINGRIDALQRDLGAQISDLQATKVPLAALENYVSTSALRKETCNLTWQLQIREYKAVSTAYLELYQMMTAAADLYSGRELNEYEKQQLKEIVRRRSAIQTKKAKVDLEIETLREKFSLNRGCE